MPRYRAAFEYRFNQQYGLAAMLPRLISGGWRPLPMPDRVPKLPEVFG